MSDDIFTTVVHLPSGGTCATFEWLSGKASVYSLPESESAPVSRREHAGEGSRLAMVSGCIANRSWRVEWEQRVSPIAVAADEVLAAAGFGGGDDEPVAIKLKSLLEELAADAGREPADFGAAIRGIVGGFVKPIARHLAAGGDA